MDPRKEEFDPHIGSPQMTKKGKVLLIVSLLFVFSLFFIQHIRTKNVYGVYKDENLDVLYVNSSNCSREWFGDEVVINGKKYQFIDSVIAGIEVKLLFGTEKNNIEVYYNKSKSVK